MTNHMQTKEKKMVYDWFSLGKEAHRDDPSVSLWGTYLIEKKALVS